VTGLSSSLLASAPGRPKVARWLFSKTRSGVSRLRTAKRDPAATLLCGHDRADPLREAAPVLGAHDTAIAASAPAGPLGRVAGPRGDVRLARFRRRVGGGPAGSTIAALLAERGVDVVLLEKDRHPRFHIGESLLPFNLPLFERLGVADAVERIGLPKWGVEFVSPCHRRTVTFEFGYAWEKCLPSSFLARWSDLDHILIRNAASKGSRVIEARRVTNLDLDHPEGVEVIAHIAAEQAAVGTGATGDRIVAEGQRWHARFLVDASGRDTLVASKLGMKDRNRRHASAAIYGHFTGARRQEGRAEGNISIFWFDHGWIWFIPLLDGTTSIGAVCRPEHLKSRKTDLNAFFMSTIAMCPEIAGRLKDAKLAGPATATGR